jgi:hypothetical protein
LWNTLDDADWGATPLSALLHYLLNHSIPFATRRATAEVTRRPATTVLANVLGLTFGHDSAPFAWAGPLSSRNSFRSTCVVNRLASPFVREKRPPMVFGGLF